MPGGMYEAERTKVRGAEKMLRRAVGGDTAMRASNNDKAQK